MAGPSDLIGKVLVVVGASRGFGCHDGGDVRSCGRSGGANGSDGATSRAANETRSGPRPFPRRRSPRPRQCPAGICSVDHEVGPPGPSVSKAASMTHALAHEATDEEIVSIIGTTSARSNDARWTTFTCSVPEAARS